VIISSCHDISTRVNPWSSSRTFSSHLILLSRRASSEPKRCLEHAQCRPFPNVSGCLTFHAVLLCGFRTLRRILFPFLLDFGSARATLVLRDLIHHHRDMLSTPPPGRLAWFKCHVSAIKVSRIKRWRTACPASGFFAHVEVVSRCCVLRSG
jgi:hypothetical protein